MGDGVIEERRSRRLVIDDAMWNCKVAYRTLERSKSLALRIRRERRSVSKEAIEKEWRQWKVQSQTLDVEPPSEPAHRLLKRQRRSVPLERQHFSIENNVTHRQARDAFDDFRHRGGDVAQRPGKHTHVARRFVYLYARTVELQFKRSLPECVDRVGNAFCRRGEHRLDRAEHLDGIP